MAVGNTTDVQGRGRPVVTEKHIVKILHQRSTSPLQRMIHATELRYNRGVGQHGDHARFTDLQTTGISVLGPHLVERGRRVVLLHLVMLRRFLVDSLSVIPDDIDILACEIVLLHQFRSGLREHCATHIVQTGQFENAQGIVKCRKHLLLDVFRPVDG